MAVRVRSDGRILCAATHPARRGDTLAYLLFHKPGVAPDVNGGFS